MDNSMEVLLHLQQLLDKIPVAERQALKPPHRTTHDGLSV